MDGAIRADYLVVGAGATGMAFVDALIDHADVKVVMIDRRYATGGHWLDAYPFVRLHQASAFYGVASTMLGDGRIQTTGPEKGLGERATAAEVSAYYQRVLQRMTTSGKVDFHPSCEYTGDNRFVSLLSGRHYEVSGSCRVVDARYLSPDIPARTAPPFGVADARVIPVNDLVRVTDAPSQFVIVGSGKTATDACIWLLGNGVDPASICWVRPRDPWMLNRAVVQPDPAVFLGMAADTMTASAAAASPNDLFLRLEAAGVMLRIDESVTPTMAKTPTIAHWEIDLLRSIEQVVRLGHIRHVERGRISLSQGDVTVARDALVVHCAASGLKYPPVAPVWSREAITLQPVRSGFPCFGAAIIGYVEATRDNDAEKNRACPPSPLPDTATSWARMQVLGNLASLAFTAQPDIREWANHTTLNPGRIPPERIGDPDIAAALERYRNHAVAGFARLAEFAALP
jgi:hypothetical protein